MKKFFKVFFVIVLILAIFSCLYFFVWKDDEPRKTDKPSTEVEVNIEDCDNYIDYIRKNQDDETNYYLLKIYNAFIDNLDEMKAGENSISLKNYLSRNELNEAYYYIADATAGALTCLIFDNPELFYLSFDNMTINVETSFNIVTDIIFERGNNFYESSFSNETEIDEALADMRSAREEFYEQMPTGLNDYETVKYVNDFLVESVEYDQTLSQDLVHSAYGALVNGLAVCDGYSYATKYLLDGLDITCFVGAGEATASMPPEGHMWNYVQLYGNWYGLDVTWNDPDLGDLISYDYFLLGGDMQRSTGFYSVKYVRNYIYSFGSDYYAFPVPKILETNFVFPKINNITMQEINEGDSIIGVEFSFTTTGLVNNNTIAYAVSKDGGKTYSDYIAINGNLSLDDVSQNGIYKFRIQTSKGGEVIFEYKDTFTVAIAEGSTENVINFETVKLNQAETLQLNEINIIKLNETDNFIFDVQPKDIDGLTLKKVELI